MIRLLSTYGLEIIKARKNLVGVNTHMANKIVHHGLKNNLIIQTELINGDYQELAGGLQIRFQGSADDSTATQNDEWEVEVMGLYEETDNPSIRSVRMSRKDFKQFYKV